MNANRKYAQILINRDFVFLTRDVHGRAMLTYVCDSVQDSVQIVRNVGVLVPENINAA